MMDDSIIKPTALKFEKNNDWFFGKGIIPKCKPDSESNRYTIFHSIIPPETWCYGFRVSCSCSPSTIHWVGFRLRNSPWNDPVWSNSLSDHFFGVIQLSIPFAIFFPKIFMVSPCFPMVFSNDRVLDHGKMPWQISWILDLSPKMSGVSQWRWFRSPPGDHDGSGTWNLWRPTITCGFNE